MSAHSIPEQKPMLSQAGEVHNDPYPSQPAMEAAVELEVHACLGRVQTQTVGKVIQRAIDKSRTWQPIETAPRGGTLFLAYVPDSSISEIVFCRRDAEDEDWMMDWGNEATVIDIPVTHWMPLPEAPE